MKKIRRHTNEERGGEGRGEEKERNVLEVDGTPGRGETGNGAAGAESRRDEVFGQDGPSQGDHGADGAAGDVDGEEVASADLIVYYTHIYISINPVLKKTFSRNPTPPPSLLFKVCGEKK